MKSIYGTIRLKYHIKNNLFLNLNHKLIRRYKNILGLKTIETNDLKKGLIANCPTELFQNYITIFDKIFFCLILADGRYTFVANKSIQ